MKVKIAMLLLAAGGLACSRQNEPPQVAAAAPAPAVPLPPGEREMAPTSESAPVATGLPTSTPQVAPPTVPASPPADQTPLTLTPASGTSPPRASAQLVPPSSARDKPKSSDDQESIREIRALLASDRNLAPFAPRVAIVARDGRVWLRGQVNTAEQRAAIEKLARQAAGVINVDNELVVSE
jgi:BON domain